MASPVTLFCILFCIPFASNGSIPLLARTPNAPPASIISVFSPPYSWASRARRSIASGVYPPASVSPSVTDSYTAPFTTPRPIVPAAAKPAGPLTNPAMIIGADVPKALVITSIGAIESALTPAQS